MENQHYPFTMSPMLQDFSGYRVIQAPPPGPKIQIRRDFQWIDPEIRSKVNMYLAETFGFEKGLGDEIIVDRARRTMVMSIETYAAFKQAMAKPNSF